MIKPDSWIRRMATLKEMRAGCRTLVKQLSRFGLPEADEV